MAEGGAGGKHVLMCSPGIEIYLNLYIFVDQINTYLLMEFLDIKSKGLRRFFVRRICDTRQNLEQLCNERCK